MVAHAALLHDVDALARRQRERHVLLDQKDGDALVVQELDDVADLRDHARHQAFGRLVEQDDFRLQHHGPRDGEHLLLAARQRAAGLAAPLRQHRKEREHLVEQAAALFFGHAVAVEAGAQVLHHREQAEDAAVLRHIADAAARELVRRQAGDGAALEPDRTAARAHQPHDRFQRGALADAVAAEQTDHLARRDSERNAMQNMALAVIRVHLVERDKRRCARDGRIGRQTVRQVVRHGAHVLR